MFQPHTSLLQFSVTVFIKKPDGPSRTVPPQRAFAKAAEFKLKKINTTSPDYYFDFSNMFKLVLIALKLWSSLSDSYRQTHIHTYSHDNPCPRSTLSEGNSKDARLIHKIAA